MSGLYVCPDCRHQFVQDCPNCQAAWDTARASDRAYQKEYERVKEMENIAKGQRDEAMNALHRLTQAKAQAANVTKRLVEIDHLHISMREKWKRERTALIEVARAAKDIFSWNVNEGIKDGARGVMVDCAALKKVLTAFANMQHSLRKEIEK